VTSSSWWISASAFLLFHLKIEVFVTKAAGRKTKLLNSSNQFQRNLASDFVTFSKDFTGLKLECKIAKLPNNDF
jgi:hypothetical protein